MSVETTAALEALEHQACYLLVTDLNMPGATGGELAGAIRATHSGLSVLALSGCLDGRSANELRAAGIARVLTKPCPAGTLLDATAALTTPATRGVRR